MGLPESGHGSSHRRSSSDLVPKGIRKSARKSSQPSTALKKLRFGDVVPPMLPAPENAKIQSESDLSVSPSKGNVSALVKNYEEGAVTVPFDSAADDHKPPINLAISHLPSSSPAGSPTQTPSASDILQQPQFHFGRGKFASSIASVNRELYSCDDAAVETLIPVSDEVACLGSADVRARSVSPIKSSRYLKSQPSPAMPISVEQAAMLDFAEALPLSKSLPPISISAPTHSNNPTLLPSIQITLLNPVYDPSTDLPTQNIPLLPCPASAAKLEIDVNDFASMDTSEFPPLNSSVAAPVNPNCWNTRLQNSPPGNGNVESQTKESMLQPESHDPLISQLFKAPVRAGGPVAFDHLILKEIGSVEFCEGKSLLKFSHADTLFLAGQLGFALVGKFSHSIPSPFYINKALGNIKLAGSLSWNFLNSNHILIKLSEQCDYVKMLNGVNDLPVWYIGGCPMRVFIWTPEFHPAKETPVVAVWCKLPGLPVHLYDHSALLKIGSLLGKPLQIDYATAHRERASFARICVEMDLTKHAPEVILLDINNSIFNQRVVYENLPKFCIDCNHVGHSVDSCYANVKNPRPVKRMDGRREAGKQESGSKLQSDGLKGDSGKREISTDGFQKVTYRKKQSSGTSQQRVDAVNISGVSNRFANLNEDMDTSEANNHMQVQEGDQGKQILDLVKSHDGNRLHKSANLMKTHPILNVQKADVVPVSLAILAEDMDISEQPIQHLPAGRSPSKVAGLDQSHSGSGNKVQMAGFHIKPQHSVKVAGILAARAGKGKEKMVKHTSSEVLRGENSDALKSDACADLELQHSGTILRTQQGVLDQSTVGELHMWPAGESSATFLGSDILCDRSGQFGSDFMDSSDSFLHVHDRTSPAEMMMSEVQLGSAVQSPAKDAQLKNSRIPGNSTCADQFSQEAPNVVFTLDVLKASQLSVATQSPTLAASFGGSSGQFEGSPGPLSSS